MQPYQEASEEIRRQGEFPIRAAKKGISALGAVGGGLAATKVLPFLSKYIPEGLALKGLSKLDPRFGKFIQTAMSNGKSFDEVKDFIGEKIQGSMPQEPAKENRNIIEQYSPELFQFIKQGIQSGHTPTKIGVQAYKKGFDKIIRQIEKDHKASFSEILSTVFGNTQQAQQPQVAQEQPPQQGQPPQQSGQGQQALMAIMQKINQKLGG